MKGKGFAKSPKPTSYPHPIINIIHIGRAKPDSGVFWVVIYEDAAQETKTDVIVAKSKGRVIQKFIEAHCTPTPEKLQEFIASFIVRQYGRYDFTLEPTFPDDPEDKTLSIFLKGSECGWIYLTDEGIRVSDAFLEDDQQEIIQAVQSWFGSRVLCFSSGSSLYIEIEGV
jgi:hypothetical protein